MKAIHQLVAEAVDNRQSEIVVVRSGRDAATMTKVQQVLNTLLLARAVAGELTGWSVTESYEAPFEGLPGDTIFHVTLH